MIWCVIVIGLILMSIGMCVLSRVIQYLYDKYDQQQEQAENKYNYAKHKFINSGTLDYYNALNAFEISEDGKMLAEAKESARLKYKAFRNKRIVQYLENDVLLYCTVAIAAVAVFGFIVCTSFMIARAPFCVERTLLDKEEVRNAIIAKAQAAEFYDGSGVEHIGYPSKSLELRAEVISEIKDYNRWINHNIISKKSLWTNWFIPDEYAELEKLDYNMILAEH